AHPQRRAKATAPADRPGNRARADRSGSLAVLSWRLELRVGIHAHAILGGLLRRDLHQRNVGDEVAPTEGLHLAAGHPVDLLREDAPARVESIDEKLD